MMLTHYSTSIGKRDPLVSFLLTFFTGIYKLYFLLIKYMVIEMYIFGYIIISRRGKKGEDDLHKMPSSCSDLNLIGHTLNGFYLVQESNKGVNKSGANKMQTVYCDFQPPVSSSSTKVGTFDRIIRDS